MSPHDLAGFYYFGSRSSKNCINRQRNRTIEHLSALGRQLPRGAERGLDLGSPFNHEDFFRIVFLELKDEDGYERALQLTAIVTKIISRRCEVNIIGNDQELLTGRIKRAEFGNDSVDW